MQNQMNQHQNNKNNGYNKVDIAPFVSCHGEQSLNVAGALPAVKLLSASTCAGWQDILDNNAGANQTKQAYKTKQIDNEIQRSSLHKITCKFKVLSCPKKISGDLKGYHKRICYFYNDNRTKMFIFISGWYKTISKSTIDYFLWIVNNSIKNLQKKGILTTGVKI